MDDRSDSGKTRDTLDRDLDDYLKEKDRIRGILGRVGGVPRAPGRVFNATVSILVGACFVVALLVQEPAYLPFELALLLVSLKLLYMMHQNAKAVHFQFWMLSTIEWRLNDIGKRLRALEKTPGGRAGEDA